MPERRHVVVAGAGFAGLAAAWRLAERGVAVTLLESAGHTGGRAARAEWDGVEVDPIVPRVVPADACLLELVRDAGLGALLLPLRPLAQAQVHRGRVRPIEPIGLAGVARLPGVSPREALRLARLPRLLRRFAAQLDPERPERAAGLDDRSVADFGRLYFGRGVVERWMEPTLAETAPDDERRTSRVAFLLRHVRDHWLAPASLRMPPGRLAEALGRRLGVQLGHEVEGLEPSARGVSVRVRGPGGARRIEADAAVLALPADAARRVAEPLLTRAERDLLAQVEYLPAITALVTARPPLVAHATRVRVPRAEAGVLAAVTLEALSREAEVPPLHLLVARAPWSRERLDAPDDAIAKELEAEAGRLLPVVPDGVRVVCVHRFARAWPRFPVGAYRALARLRALQQERRRAGRRLYLAGDYLVAPTLEGAVASGLRAAAEAASDLAAPAGVEALPPPGAREDGAASLRGTAGPP